MNCEIEDVALFDLDGTLADYEKRMSCDLSRLLAPGEKLSMDDSLPHVEARMALVKSQPGWWANLPRLESGFKILAKAQALGFEAHILTKGPFKTDNAWTEKRVWCKKNAPGVLVTVTEDKGLVYGKVLVDDYPDYMLRWLAWRPRGLGIMPARAWNEGFSHPQVIKYDGSNLREVAKALAKAKERKG